MNLKNIIVGIVICFMALSCSDLDTREDLYFTDEMIESNYGTIQSFGYMGYTYLDNGFNALDKNLRASITDEAEHTASSSSSQRFNTGSWNAFNNPDDLYEYLYEGIRATNYFLENYSDYENLLAQNRDTLTDNAYQYHRDVENVGWLYNENRVLRAFFYFD